MITGLGHAAIIVKDMEESVRFYTQALGCKRAFEIPHPADGSPWIVYLSVGGGQFVELFYGGVEELPYSDSRVGFQHLCFAVDDIYAAAQQVKDAGYQLTAEPVAGVDYNMQAWTTDPNGIRIELMQMDPRSPHAAFM